MKHWTISTYGRHGKRCKATPNEDGCIPLAQQARFEQLTFPLEYHLYLRGHAYSLPITGKGMAVFDGFEHHFSINQAPARVTIMMMILIQKLLEGHSSVVVLTCNSFSGDVAFKFYYQRNRICRICNDKSKSLVFCRYLGYMNPVAERCRKLMTLNKHLRGNALNCIVTEI
ncbi:uncharacterized protein LOC112126896 [Cimex lectularius]|uniref:Uncharacterized protein n=1 Tax=Cimex lectularius TaxID=79782 RepID=A0A8I6SPV7_CIMLE|nr:uncharacterized protein LOC112126896 [Cimex lectularius]